MINEAKIAVSIYHLALAVGFALLRNDPDNGEKFLWFYMHIGPLRVELTF